MIDLRAAELASAPTAAWSPPRRSCRRAPRARRPPRSGRRLRIPPRFPASGRSSASGRRISRTPRSWGLRPPSNQVTGDARRRAAWRVFAPPEGRSRGRARRSAGGTHNATPLGAVMPSPRGASRSGRACGRFGELGGGQAPPVGGDGCGPVEHFGHVDSQMSTTNRIAATSVGLPLRACTCERMSSTPMTSEAITVVAGAERQRVVVAHVRNSTGKVE